MRARAASAIGCMGVYESRLRPPWLVGSPQSACGLHSATMEQITQAAQARAALSPRCRRSPRRPLEHAALHRASPSIAEAPRRTADCSNHINIKLPACRGLACDVFIGGFGRALSSFVARRVPVPRRRALLVHFSHACSASRTAALRRASGNGPLREGSVCADCQCTRLHHGAV